MFSYSWRVNSQVNGIMKIDKDLWNVVSAGLVRLVKRYGFSVAIHVGYLFLFAFAYWLAFAFRYDFNFELRGFALFQKSVVWAVLLKMGVFLWHDQFRNSYIFAGFKDALVLFKSSLVASFGFFLIAYYFFDCVLSKTIPVMDCVFTVVLVGSFRFGWRIFHQEILPRFSRYPSKKTLVIGANKQGASLVSELQSYPELGYHIVGYVSIHDRKVGQRMEGVPVLGHFDDAKRILLKHGIREVLTFAEVLNATQLRQIMEICSAHRISIRVVPNMETRLGSKKFPVREIRIEDLLRREPVELDDTIISELIAGKNILVTGAGGSIGSEICRQVIRFAPKSLAILGRGENRIFFLEKELRQLGFDGNLLPVIADVSHASRMEHVFQQHSFDVVFHAAAHKHVPLMEENPCEAVTNNVRGTQIVADLAHLHGVSTFVLVSTDKAVNPTSVMGASKHMAERYVQAMSRHSSTRFITTRFGNVLGSNGSVVPVFQKQIEAGGPITITDFRMTRYFMTIPEASQLVLQAAAMGLGGEIFVLDMGAPVRILDLAKDMVRMSGLPEKAIEIQQTGMRPGEKMYEELYFESEKAIPTSHKKLRCASHREFDLEQVRNEIVALLEAAQTSPEAVKQALQSLIKEYHPSGSSVLPERPPQVVYRKHSDIRGLKIGG